MTLSVYEEQIKISLKKIYGLTDSQVEDVIRRHAGELCARWEHGSSVHDSVNDIAAREDDFKLIKSRDENVHLRAALKCFNDLLKENGWHTANVLKRHKIDPKILEAL